MSDTQPGAVITIGAVMPTLGCLAVALRFYIRRKFRHPILVDDWILLPAALLTIGMGASLIAGVRLHALGYPTPITGDPNNPLTPIIETNSAITVTSKVEWALQLMQVVALGCIKLSFLFFYRRIFVGRTSTWFSHITWGMIVLICLWTVAFFFALLAACKGNWSAWWGSVLDLSTKCVKTLQLEMALVTTDFITDVIIILLPIPKIWGLHMPTGRKIAVSGVFLMGAVSIAASIVRMNQFIQVITIGFDPHEDEDLHLTSNLYWSMFESGIALIAVCLPTFRSLWSSASHSHSHPLNPAPSSTSSPSLKTLLRSVFSLHSFSSSSQSSDNAGKMGSRGGEIGNVRNANGWFVEGFKPISDDDSVSMGQMSRGGSAGGGNAGKVETFAMRQFEVDDRSEREREGEGNRDGSTFTRAEDRM